jgi:hypothetical protein
MHSRLSALEGMFPVERERPKVPVGFHNRLEKLARPKGTGLGSSSSWTQHLASLTLKERLAELENAPEPLVQPRKPGQQLPGLESNGDSKRSPKMGASQSSPNLDGGASSRVDDDRPEKSPSHTRSKGQKSSSGSNSAVQSPKRSARGGGESSARGGTPGGGTPATANKAAPEEPEMQGSASPHGDVVPGNDGADATVAEEDYQAGGVHAKGVSTTMFKAAKAGDTELDVASTAGFQIGNSITVGDEAVRLVKATEPTRHVKGFGSIVLERPLAQDHDKGTIVKVVQDDDYMEERAGQHHSSGGGYEMEEEAGFEEAAPPAPPNVQDRGMDADEFEEEPDDLGRTLKSVPQDTGAADDGAMPDNAAADPPGGSDQSPGTDDGFDDEDRPDSPKSKGGDKKDGDDFEDDEQAVGDPSAARNDSFDEFEESHVDPGGKAADVAPLDVEKDDDNPDCFEDDEGESPGATKKSEFDEFEEESPTAGNAAASKAAAGGLGEEDDDDGDADAFEDGDDGDAFEDEEASPSQPRLPPKSAGSDQDGFEESFAPETPKAAAQKSSPDGEQDDFEDDYDDDAAPPPVSPAAKASPSASPGGVQQDDADPDAFEDDYDDDDNAGAKDDEFDDDEDDAYDDDDDAA